MIDWRALFQEHAPRLIEVAAAITGSRVEAEDVVQEAFLKAYRDQGRFRGEAQPSTWIRRIVVNLAIDVRRRQGTIRRDPAEVEELWHGAPDPQALSAQNERDEAVRRAVAALPEDQRTVLVMKEFGGLTTREIAERLSLPQGTVDSRVIRARARLRDELGPYLRDDESTEGRG